MLFVVGGVNERGLDAHLRQPLREKLIYTAINISLRDDVVSGFEEGHERGCDGSHAGGEGQGRVHALQRRNCFFCNRIGWITVPCIEMVSVCGAQLLVIVGDFESRGLINRSGQGSVFLLQIRSAAHSLGFGVMLFHLRCLAAIRLIG